MLKQKVMLMALILIVGLGGYAGADLIGLYNFEGDFTDTSESDTVFDGTPTATAPSFVTDTPRGTGQAVEFLSGTGLNCGNVSGEGLDVTLSFWIKETGGTSTYCIPINKWNDSDVAGLFGYGILLRGGGENHSMLFRMGNYQSYGGWGSELRTSENAYALDKWNHLLFTYVDATDTATAYLNGEFDAEMTGIQDRGEAGAANKIEDLLMGSSTSEGFQGMLDEVAIWDHALTADEARSVYESGVQPAGPADPAPEDGETVGTANPLTLSWTNMEPEDSNDLVYVDVWWGTEPNALSPDYDMTLVVTAESVDSKDVDSSAEDTYYWRVDSYLNGADNINEPNKFEGQLWSYTTVSDLAPTVDIVTLDQMTWSGQGVPLDATVTDDNLSAKTIEWSADLPNGISAVFNPGNEADTTVTLTKVPYGEANIVNAGFEDPVLADGADALTPEVPGWAEGYYGAGGTSWDSWNDLCRAINPDVAYGYGGVAPQGENIAYCRVDPGYDGGVTQTLTEVLQAETTYELSVMVGTPSGVATPGPYHIELLAGDLKVAEEIGDAPASDTWITVTLTHTTGSAATDPTVGQPITIRLVAADTAVGGTDVNFDDVRLTADPGFAPPTGVQTVTVSVAVSDAANPTPDTASIEIDVYDDACHMARVGQGRSAVTDFNGNCITGLDDLAVIAAAWLDDYSSTGPADL